MTDREKDFVPEQQWLAGLPAFTASSGGLITGPGETILIVKPWYRDRWNLPGGVAEAGESPRRCAEREVQEETGLTVTAGVLLAVGWIPSDGSRRARFAFTFDCGSVHDPQDIHLDAQEIDGFAFLPLDKALPLLSPVGARRLQAAWQARRTGLPSYLEGNG